MSSYPDDSKLRMANNKYIIKHYSDKRYGEVGELIDTFKRPDGRMMYTMLFADGELRGYYYDELETLLKRIK